jgi:hypothetical protein
VSWLQFLPRKFKIAVTVPGDNSVDILTNDIGVVVITDPATGELQGFDLLVGGGMGRTHRQVVCCYDGWMDVMMDGWISTPMVWMNVLMDECISTPMVIHWREVCVSGELGYHACSRQATSAPEVRRGRVCCVSEACQDSTVMLGCVPRRKVQLGVAGIVGFCAKA